MGEERNDGAGHEQKENGGEQSQKRKKVYLRLKNVIYQSQLLNYKIFKYIILLQFFENFRSNWPYFTLQEILGFHPPSSSYSICPEFPQISRRHSSVHCVNENEYETGGNHSGEHQCILALLHSDLVHQIVNCRIFF